MKKIGLILTLFICLCSALPTGVSAAEELVDLPTYNWSCGNPVVTDELKDKLKDFKENDANMADKFLASQAENLFNIGDVAGLSSLIYGNPYCVWMDKDDKLAADGIFTQKERTTIVDPMLKMFSGSYVVLLTLAILLSSLRMGLGSINPQARADFWQDLKMWIVSGIFMALFVPLTNIIFGVNSAIVQSIKDLLTSSGIEIDGVSIISGMEDWTVAFSFMSILITFLAEWVLALILNFIYIARKIIILLLLIMGPVAAYALMFNRTRGFFGTWIKELCSNIFLQTIHALVLFAFAHLASMGAGVLMKLGLLMMFIPVSGMISRWLSFGDSTSKLGSAMAMTGLGGVMSTIMIANQAGNIIRGGGSTSSVASTLNGGIANSSENSLVNMGGGNDSAITKISSRASGANSSIWQTIQKGAGAVGAAVGGAAGLVTMNPMGVAAGAKVGQVLTKGGLQRARNIVSGGADLGKTLVSPLVYEGANGKGVQAFFQNLSERREFAGNIGESIGSMIGFGEAGRNVGHALSGVSRNRLSQTPAALGGAGWVTGHRQDGSPIYQPMNFSDLRRTAPGSEAIHVMTNTGSAFYVKDQSAGEWMKFGTTGQADTGLNTGQVRITPYQVPTSTQGSSLQIQENGTYRMQTTQLNSGNLNNNISGGFNGNAVTSTSSTLPVAERAFAETAAGVAVSPSYSNGDIQTTGSTNNSVAAGGRSSSELAGLKGSTPDLMRVGNSFVVGGGTVDGKVEVNSINDMLSRPRMVDSNFDSSKINPDSYVAASVLGPSGQNTSERVADGINSFGASTQKVKGWGLAAINKAKERRREIV
ncbi:hypothetical protein [Bacillus sp. UMB0728]|uniref:hypothetical protein n=1 Tax=Bacillus sp. UMB0728 TaxID=2066052 RepID=UPI000C75FFA0|nr:hypothetical protein [Bacillus sp. UMB0728]PLR70463.1 hypothetical protein CYJ37_23290 [Bacillus sp. UMB0728]